MPDYSKTIIYKIQHEDNEELVYIGSTTDFTKRKYHHKSRCNNPNDNRNHLKLYQMIRDNGNWTCFRMVQLKEFPCNNRREAEAEEDKVMLELKANMNSIRASRSQKEWREDNKEQRQEYMKHYYELNKDQISQQNKQYRQLNKEEVAQKDKEYYEKNKEQRLQRQKQKVTCECGCIVNKGDLARHKKTKKHIELINETKTQ